MFRNPQFCSVSVLFWFLGDASYLPIWIVLLHMKHLWKGRKEFYSYCTIQTLNAKISPTCQTLQYLPSFRFGGFKMTWLLCLPLCSEIWNWRSNNCPQLNVIKQEKKKVMQFLHFLLFKLDFSWQTLSSTNEIYVNESTLTTTFLLRYDEETNKIRLNI